jgi:hydrogenase maturation protease
MGASSGYEVPARLLGLGNELLADDGFGIRVAREVERRSGGAVEVVTSSAAGFHLLEHLLGARSLVVVDTVQTGVLEPGTVRLWREEEVRPAPGGSPHFVGLFEVLTVARQLRLAVPEEVTIVGLEPSDCTTVGGIMHPDVEAAIPLAVAMVERLFGERVARYA